MNLNPVPVASYATQSTEWPQSGRHILANYDDETITVYQAFRPEIGRFASENDCFGGEFRYTRMSWIKPNFLWMMYRSDWGRSEGQEVVLAIRLSRAFFDSLLEQAVSSSFTPDRFSSREEWSAAVSRSDVRLQWDPDHLPTGEKCERRAIQLGLRAATLEAYGKREVAAVTDISDFVAEQRMNVASWKGGDLLTPEERVYVPSDQAISERLGLDEWRRPE